MNKKIYDATLHKYVEQEQTAKTTKVTAVIYGRVSSKKQVEEGFGLDYQLDRCKSWVGDNQEINLVGKFEDGGLTGKILNRDGLNKALEFVSKHKVTDFVCTEISRVSRAEMLIGLELMYRIRDMGCKLVLTNKGGIQDFDTAIDRLKTVIALRQAETEGINIGVRTKGGKTEKLKAGYWPFSHVPCGYDKTRIKVGKKSHVLPVINPLFGPIIKEGLELYANEVIESKVELRKFLQKKGLHSNCEPKTREKGRFTISILDSILSVERLFFYAGYILAPKFGIDEPVEGQHEPLIDRATAERIINKVIAVTRKHEYHKKQNDRFPHKGLLMCEKCERKLTSSPSCKYKNGVKIPYDYYICTNKECELHRKSISKKKIEESLGCIIEGLRASPKMIDLLGKVQSLVRDQALEDKKVEESVSTKRLKAIARNKEAIEGNLMHIAPGPLFEAMQEKWAKLNHEQSQLESSSIMSIDHDKNYGDLLGTMTRTLEKPLEIWKGGDVEMKHMLAKVRFNGKIYYSKEQGCRTPEKSVIFGPNADFLACRSSSSRIWGFEPQLPASETSVLTIDTISLCFDLDILCSSSSIKVIITSIEK